jgi:hypothetical protein
VNIFEPKFFEICPECRKKSVNNFCEQHGKIVSEKRFLISIVIDDGTGSIRGTIFHENLEKIISKNEIENIDLFSLKRKDIIGKEVMLKGQVKKNQLFDNNDFIIDSIEDVDLDNLIKELEK